MTVKVNAFPDGRRRVAGLVNVGTGSVVPAALTVSVNDWLTVPPALFAVNVRV